MFQKIFRFVCHETGRRMPNQGVIEDKPVGAGIHLGGTIKNTFTWTETIVF